MPGCDVAPNALFCMSAVRIVNARLWRAVSYVSTCFFFLGGGCLAVAGALFHMLISFSSEFLAEVRCFVS